MLLFLDYDGVLHPDAVFLSKKGPQLRSEGELFMWVDILERELSTLPNVRIVLSTSWVFHLGYSRALKRLPQSVQHRVIGSTWHSSMQKDLSDEVVWGELSRYSQIMKYVSRSRVTNWVAIDDDSEGWPLSERRKLVLSHSDTGLSDVDTVRELRTRLRGS